MPWWPQHRVLPEDSVLYLGLGNKLGIVEPHDKRPFLAYLPPARADRYRARWGPKVPCAAGVRHGPLAT